VKWNGRWICLKSGWTGWTNNAPRCIAGPRPGAQRQLEAKQDRAKHKGVKNVDAARASRYEYEAMDDLAIKHTTRSLSKATIRNTTHHATLTQPT
jgi:hypothetical protein